MMCVLILRIFKYVVYRLATCCLIMMMFPVWKIKFQTERMSSIFPRGQLLWFHVCFPGQRSPSERGLLLKEIICSRRSTFFSFRCLSPFRMVAEKKLIALLLQNCSIYLNGKD